jgi:hypothetical protein
MTMPDVERLLQEFIAEDRAGGAADPLDYLARVEGGDRSELEALIDGYLARASRRPFDPGAFAGSRAEANAAHVARALGGVSGAWPVVLPRLRHRARLRRTDVVQQLAQQLGAEAQRDKIAGYYHAMEQGTLPAAGVSARVLDALARVLGVTAARLREAGEAAAGAAPGSSASVAFARVGAPDPAYDEPEPPTHEPAPETPPDAVDALFTAADG